VISHRFAMGGKTGGSSEHRKGMGEGASMKKGKQQRRKRIEGGSSGKGSLTEGPRRCVVPVAMVSSVRERDRRIKGKGKESPVVK